MNTITHRSVVACICNKLCVGIICTRTNLQSFTKLIIILRPTECIFNRTYRNKQSILIYYRLSLQYDSAPIIFCKLISFIVFNTDGVIPRGFSVIISYQGVSVFNPSANHFRHIIYRHCGVFAKLYNRIVVRCSVKTRFNLTI